jgi:prepilin-type N-terminal cleavage/methylation domain-containing protein
MRKTAFTLLELTFVLVVIAILVTMAVTSYHKSIVKSREKLAIQNLYAIQKAEKIYHIKEGKYTSDINELNIDIDDLYYNYSIQVDGDSFTITATPNQGGAPTLVLDQDGNLTRE